MVALLGFASGYPLLFSSEIFRAMVVSSNGGYGQLMWTSLLSVPYLICWLWAPWADFCTNSGMLAHRSCIIGLFVFNAFLIYMLGYIEPLSQFALAMSIAFLIAFVSATQDHIIESYRRLALPASKRALGVSLSMVMFRLSIMFAGGGGLIYADTYGWPAFFSVSALLMLFFALAANFLPDVEVENQRFSLRAQYAFSRKALSALWSNRPKLMFLVTYRLGGFWIEVMLLVFLMQFMSFSLAEVGWAQKMFGTAGLILGGALAKSVLERYAFSDVFVVSLFSQVLVCVAFFSVALGAVAPKYLVWLIVFQCAAQGVMGTASSIWMLNECTPETPTFDFALWYGVSAVGRIIAGPPANWIVSQYGWDLFFMLGVLMSFGSMLAGWYYFTHRSLLQPVHPTGSQNA